MPVSEALLLLEKCASWIFLKPLRYPQFWTFYSRTFTFTGWYKILRWNWTFGFSVQNKHFMYLLINFNIHMKTHWGNFFSFFIYFLMQGKSPHCCLHQFLLWVAANYGFTLFVTTLKLSPIQGFNERARFFLMSIWADWIKANCPAAKKCPTTLIVALNGSLL